MLAYCLPIGALGEELSKLVEARIDMGGEFGDLVQQREISTGQLNLGLADQLAPIVAAEHFALIEIGKVVQQSIADGWHASIDITVAKVLWIEFASSTALPDLTCQPERVIGAKVKGLKSQLAVTALDLIDHRINAHPALLRLVPVLSNTMVYSIGRLEVATKTNPGTGWDALLAQHRGQQDRVIATDHANTQGRWTCDGQRSSMEEVDTLKEFLNASWPEWSKRRVVEFLRVNMIRRA